MRGKDHSFVYTLKNPHNYPPSKYANKERFSISTFGIGLIEFGDSLWYHNNLSIVDQCDKEYSMINTGYSYEEDNTYGCSLYVNTAPKGCTNYFRVLDYEIFAPV